MSIPQVTTPQGVTTTSVVALVSDVWIVLAARNEEEALPSVLTDINEWGYTVLVVDDASTDNTSLTAWEHGAQCATLREHQGQQAAFILGMREAYAQGARIVVTMDADGQDNPTILPRLIEAVPEGGYAQTVRASRTTDKTAKRVLAHAWYAMMSLPDAGDYRALDRTALASLLTHVGSGDVCLRALLPQLCLPVAYVPVERLERRAGQPSYTVKDSLSLALTGVRARIGGLL